MTDRVVMRDSIQIDGQRRAHGPHAHLTPQCRDLGIVRIRIAGPPEVWI